MAEEKKDNEEKEKAEEGTGSTEEKKDNEEKEKAEEGGERGTVTERSPEEEEEVEAPGEDDTGDSGSLIAIVRKSFMDWFATKKGKAAIVGFICITAGLAGLFNYQASAIPVKSLDEVMANAPSNGGGGGGKDIFANFKDENASASLSGNLQEGNTDTKKIEVGDYNVHSMFVVVSWNDEPDEARHTNEPDSFDVEVTSPDGRTATGKGSNEQGSTGQIAVTLERDISKEAAENKDLKKKTQEPTWTGDWTINITLTSAGDQEPTIPDPFGFRTIEDSGNAYSTNIVWNFKVKE